MADAKPWDVDWHNAATEPAKEDSIYYVTQEEAIDLARVILEF